MVNSVDGARREVEVAARRVDKRGGHVLRQVVAELDAAGGFILDVGAAEEVVEHPQAVVVVDQAD